MSFTEERTFTESSKGYTIALVPRSEVVPTYEALVEDLKIIFGKEEKKENRQFYATHQHRDTFAVVSWVQKDLKYELRELRIQRDGGVRIAPRPES
jgi:hypothetical protein